MLRQKSRMFRTTSGFMSRIGLRSKAASRRKRRGTPVPMLRVRARLIRPFLHLHGRATSSSPRIQPVPSHVPSGQKPSGWSA